MSYEIFDRAHLRSTPPLCRARAKGQCNDAAQRARMWKFNSAANAIYPFPYDFAYFMAWRLFGYKLHLDTRPRPLSTLKFNGVVCACGLCTPFILAKAAKFEYGRNRTQQTVANDKFTVY